MDKLHQSWKVAGGIVFAGIIIAGGVFLWSLYIDSSDDYTLKNSEDNTRLEQKRDISLNTLKIQLEKKTTFEVYHVMSGKTAIIDNSDFRPKISIKDSNGTINKIFEFESESNAVVVCDTCVSFSPEGKYLHFSIGKPNTDALAMRLVDVTNGHLIESYNNIFAIKELLWSDEDRILVVIFRSCFFSSDVGVFVSRYDKINELEPVFLAKSCYLGDKIKNVAIQSPLVTFTVDGVGDYIFNTQTGDVIRPDNEEELIEKAKQEESRH